MFLCTALLFNEIYLPMRFQVNTSYTFRNMARTRKMYEKFQRAIIQKLWKQKWWFLCTALFLNEIYLPMKFQVDTSYTFLNMARTRKKYEEFQRAIIQKLCHQELRFLCTALLLNEFYLPVKFQVDTSYRRAWGFYSNLHRWFKKWQQG